MKEETKRIIRRLQHRGRKLIEWDDCICHQQNVHTWECRRNHRKNKVYYYSTVIRKNLRKERKKKHLCASCGNKVKPKIIYSYRCDDCQEKIRDYNRRRND